DVHRLTEGDVNVCIGGLIDRAVGWRGCRNCRRRICRLETEDKVGVHVVRWIAAVLVRDLCGEDRDRARFPRRKVSGRIDRESSWTTSYHCVGNILCAAGRADDLEPVTRDVYRFAEGDRYICTSRLIRCAVGRRRCVN